MLLRGVSAALLALLCLGSLVSAADYDPAARAALVAPYIDDQTIAIGYVDTRRVDVEAIFKAIDDTPQAKELLKNTPQEEMRKSVTELSTYMVNLRKAGLREVFLVVSLADVPARMPFFVFTTEAENDPLAIEKIIFAGPEGGNGQHPPEIQLQKVKGNLVLGHEATLARLKSIAPTPRPELAKALEMAGDTMLQGALIPSDDSRRVISELVPQLPQEIGEATGEDLANAVRYAAVGLDLPPRPQGRLGIQSKDQASAAKLQTLAKNGLTLLAKAPGVEEIAPGIDELVKVLLPTQQGDRLTIALTEENGGAAKAMTLLMPPVVAARAAAARAQAKNNLKQFALALHNYHDAYGHLPVAQPSKDGKPLLSWRVHILPFVEQQQLYEQFKLDEPWDSDNNKKLIEKMPKIFEIPGMTLAPGKTAYLVPTGEKMVFDGDRKTTFNKITDGTSNTIMIVEANADQAVIWTKPDDLPIDLEKPLAGLGKARGNNLLAAFCDGSVRVISGSIDPKTLAALLTMNGGEVVDPNR